jgi:hypothetical protein
MALGASFNKDLHVKLHPVSTEGCYEYSNGSYVPPINNTDYGIQQPDM